MTTRTLPTIPAAAVPAQTYAHSADHNLSLTRNPATFRPITGSGSVKPHEGGLWTSPITARTPDGLPADSAWIDWRRTELDDDSSYYTLLTEITPTDNARILWIDTQDHLTAIVDAYPATPHYISNISYPDWPALAADGWDAVYLTDDGQWATRLPRTGPDLYGWDMECMLWLRHAYTVGRTATAAQRSKVA